VPADSSETCRDGAVATISTREAAEITGLSQRSIQRLIKSGMLPDAGGTGRSKCTTRSCLDAISFALDGIPLDLNHLPDAAIELLKLLLENRAGAVAEALYDSACRVQMARSETRRYDESAPYTLPVLRLTHGTAPAAIAQVDRLVSLAIALNRAGDNLDIEALEITFAQVRGYLAEAAAILIRVDRQQRTHSTPRGRGTGS
jgi:hypothetical protein